MRVVPTGLILFLYVLLAGVLRAEVAFDAPEPIAKVPAPTTAQQQKADKLIRDLFKDEYSKTTPPDKLSLALKLANNADETKNDHASRYTLWILAAVLAAEAGDLELLYGLHERIEAHFIGEFIDLKKGHLGILSLNTKDAVLSKTALAYRTLLDKPNDPMSCLTVGKYLCFGKGDFARGLPMLAKSVHSGLKPLAKLELDAPEGPDDQLALGDAWWELNEKSDDKDERRQYQQRAIYWYEKVLPTQQGLSKVKIEKRMAAFLAAGGVKTVPQAKAEVAPKSKAVSLLKKIDVNRDTVRGDWAFENGILSSEQKTRETLFQLPVHPGNSYDLRVVFVSMSDKGDVGFILPHSRQQVFLSVSGWDNTIAGLTLIDEKMAVENNTWASHSIQRGTRYELLVQVRPKMIRALLDGTEITNYKFNVPNFRLLNYMKLRDEQAVGLANWFGAAQYYAVEITEFKPEQVSPAADLVIGKWQPTHPEFHENIWFKADGSFVIDKRLITGKWDLREKVLTMKWDLPRQADQLGMADANSFAGKNGFVLKRVTKVRKEE